MNSRVELRSTIKPMLIVEMGKTFAEISAKEGDFCDWIQNILKDTVCEVVNPRTQLLPNPLHYSGIILTGSHDMVTSREDWSEKTASWLRICRHLKCPILGICYGHQLIAQTFGGWVEENPKGLEIGTHHIQLTSSAKDDVVFKHLPQAFDAHLVHYQSVVQLPTNAKILAFNSHDQYQAYCLDGHIWGVQFHPEFSMNLMTQYIKAIAISDNSIDNEIKVENTDWSQKILCNFRIFCQNKKPEIKS